MPKAAAPLLLLSLITAGLPCQPWRMLAASAQQMQTDRAALLADSELRYSESGGFAGLVSGARIRASAGAITVEYRPASARHETAPETGILPPSKYIEVWAEAERAGIWRLKGRPPTRGGADIIQYQLEARVGDRAASVRWTEEDLSPVAVKAAEIGSRIVEVARRVAAPLQ